MTYKTLLCNFSSHVCTITLNQVEQKNVINRLFLEELHSVLDAAEQAPSCRVIVLEGKSGVFCTGMDLVEAVEQRSVNAFLSKEYMAILKRFATISRVVIAKVDGEVMAGGVGLVAAADLVVGTSNASFSLSEALWGLLPACVLPYLIRRVGFQSAYKMTLTTLKLNAEQAKQINLIDEFVDYATSVDNVLRQMILRLVRLESSTISNIKQYFSKMWILTEEIEHTAVSEALRLAATPTVENNIRRYIEHQEFPWE